MMHIYSTTYQSTVWVDLGYFPGNPVIGEDHALCYGFMDLHCLQQIGN